MSHFLPDDSTKINKMILSFHVLFSDKFGTVEGMVCNTNPTDTTPGHSGPYQCSPPRLQILRYIVQDLCEKAVIKKSYSQYASPAFLAPKPRGGYRMVVDYRLLNKKVVFDTFPLPTIEYAFSTFHNAKIFCS
jgi:hypothetical protein